MGINQTIKNNRIRKGLSEEELAQKIGLTLMEYHDIEAYPDEIKTVTHLKEVRLLCKALDINLLDLLGVGEKFRDEKDSIPRNQLIQRSRENLNLSREELADKIGFEKITVQEIENDESFLEQWSIELISNLARELYLPIERLLNKKSN